MIEEGVGLHPMRGRPVEGFHPGDPFSTPAGVEHWHGAHPEIEAHQLMIDEGETEWLDPITDEQNRGVRTRPMSRSANQAGIAGLLVSNLLSSIRLLNRPVAYPASSVR
jgi:hypothetical protein